MGRSDYFVDGQYNCICDQCGRKRKSKDMRTQWDGLRVCQDCFEIRHPQDFVRGVQDNQSVPIARPDATPTFVAAAEALEPVSGGSL